MKNITIAALLIAISIGYPGRVFSQNKGLRLVFIRHAERPDNGDNLTCQGLNRSLLLPAVLYRKFGKPSNIYVPALNLGSSTKRTRMLETISPFAAKYNVNINSGYQEEDYNGIGNALLAESGTIIIVWEHNTILPILRAVGVKKTKAMDWPDSDFDSIWIVTFVNGKAVLNLDTEGIKPPSGCAF
ncbi:MAG: histidine phosphatase family protein [Bacteroidota bacterium]|nr:histidine phosphatase family protein [Bacteroidota bacterium]